MLKIFTTAIASCFLLQMNYAQLLNPNVESGIPGWDSIGTGTGVTCAGATVNSPHYSTGYVLSPTILPQYGFHFMELFSGGTTNIAALESFAGVIPGTIDTLNPQYPLFPASVSVATNGSAIRQTIPVVPGQVLTFNYLYGTNDAPQFWGCDHSSDFIDYSYFAIGSDDTSVAYLLTSTADLIGCNYYASQYGCDLPYTNSNIYCTDGSTNFFICPYWQIFTYPFNQNDTVTLSFGVVNVGDNTGTSRLILDNFSLNSFPTLSDTTLVCNANQSQTIGFNTINSLADDVDSDTICHFVINTLPANGILVLHQVGVADTLTVLEIGVLVSVNYLDSLDYIPNTNYTGIDSFTIQVVDCLNGTSNSATISLNIQFLGFENESELNILLYPNPTRGIIHVTIPSNMNEVLVEVFDMRGRLITTQYSTTEIDISGLADDLYILRLSAGNQRKIAKVLKLK